MGMRIHAGPWVADVKNLDLKVMDLSTSNPSPDAIVRCETLRNLGLGKHGAVVGVSATNSSAKRLADMGFVSGARIEMIRTGNPCLVRIGGTCVGLGSANQDCILIAARSEEAIENSIKGNGFHDPAADSRGPDQAMICRFA